MIRHSQDVDLFQSNLRRLGYMRPLIIAWHQCINYCKLQWHPSPEYYTADGHLLMQN